MDADTAYISAMIGCGGALLSQLLTMIRDIWSHRADINKQNLFSALNMRRDIYIPASKAISELQIIVGLFPYCDPSKPEFMERLSKCIHNLSPVYLVASQETIECLSKFSDQVQEGISELTIKRIRLGGVEARQKVFQEHMDNVNLQIKNLHLESSRLRASGAELTQLSLNSDECHRMVRYHSDLVNKFQCINREKIEAQFELSSCLAKIIPSLGETATEAAIAARKEMTLPLQDEAKFRRTLNSSYERAAKRHHNQVKDIKELFNETISEDHGC